MTAPITEAAGARHARIMSVGAYRPTRVVTNEELCRQLDSTDEWIRQRSGIVSRRHAGPGETVTDMAVAAARRALAEAAVEPGDLGMVLLATATHPWLVPSAAAEVVDRIGATPAGALDIGAACAGFCYGVGLAGDLVRGGSVDHVLVIGVERLSDWIDPADRSTGFLFADGAGAVVVGPSPVAGIGPTRYGSDGARRDAITMTQSLLDYRDDGGARFPTLVMDGQAVFRWAVEEMSAVARRALQAAAVAPDDLDAFIPHQANLRIIDALVRTLRLPQHVPVARDIVTAGNTSAASVPLAMDAMLRSGQAPGGGTALLLGFGAGLSYAAQVVSLPARPTDPADPADPPPGHTAHP